MDLEEKAPKRSFMDRFLPVRYVYLRSHDEVRAYALTARRQILLGLAASAFLVWSLVASGAFLFDIVTRRHADSEVIGTSFRPATSRGIENYGVDDDKKGGPNYEQAYPTTLPMARKAPPTKKTEHFRPRATTAAGLGLVLHAA